VNIPLLDRLRRSGGEFVPWPILATDWPNAAADLDELAAFGFGFERHPILGVAYRGPADRLCPDQIEWNLGTSLVGRKIAVWNRVGSTNDLAARAASSRANEGLAILTEEQTSGRGSRGRTWSAPRGSSILMSVLIFPGGPLDEPSWLTALGAVAVAEVISELTGSVPTIKWPNDVRVDRRKIAGVLVERSAGAVIGIGLNVNTSIEEFPVDLVDSATSLRRLTGTRFDRSEVAKALLRRIDVWYSRGLSDGPGSLDAPVQDSSEHLGQEVEVETGDRLVVGRLEEIRVGRGVVLAAKSGATISVESRDIRSLRPSDGGL
jgi:BirA family biotin operon repressor/biotin-[acetyl-CoA-carboxylase] ligase